MAGGGRDAGSGGTRSSGGTRTFGATRDRRQQGRQQCGPSSPINVFHRNPSQRIVPGDRRVGKWDRHPSPPPCTPSRSPSTAVSSRSMINNRPIAVFRFLRRYRVTARRAFVRSVRGIAQRPGYLVSRSRKRSRGSMTQIDSARSFNLHRPIAENRIPAAATRPTPSPVGGGRSRGLRQRSRACLTRGVPVRWRFRPPLRRCLWTVVAERRQQHRNPCSLFWREPSLEAVEVCGHVSR
jgi:hypothetical protein